MGRTSTFRDASEIWNVEEIVALWDDGGAEHVPCINMADDLEAEGERLKARLADLEREHEALHGRPQDREAHEVHRANLVEYEADVRAYGERLAAERRARGLPDLKLPSPET